MDQPNILFSDSNQYFQDAEILQWEIGFINAMDIDIYVKKSFSSTTTKVNISWWDIDAFTKDHTIDAHFICYEIQTTDRTPLWDTEGKITLGIQEKWFFAMNLVQWFIQSTPLITLLVVTLLSRIVPPPISTILWYISIIGIVITYLFYARKILHTLYKVVKAKGIDFDGVNVVYEKGIDILKIQAHHVAMVKQLKDDLDITKVVVYQGKIYLKQESKRPSFWRALRNNLTSAPAPEWETEKKVSDTLSFIFSPAFIWSYALSDDAK